ncbi:DEAD/DEAH box helicase [Bifidobacterium sp. ESL0745]|uniref:DEAD/DEAH box helicase n=1 Tax=Bifidobacterium sp. ESL0745 TaxID=2983226 RepID=UPI0023F9DA1D|nr:DEAD/DEAH box helicase [Bifidobacterium sp. ESL0745]MDF7665038.1 DEAD/DEAH box helicase [Bifidobacterium sp. ESL0745]
MSHSHHYRHKKHSSEDSEAFDSVNDTSLAEERPQSPAQRYARFKKHNAYERSEAARFARTLPFELDPFQIEANEALEAGKNVLVAAPTGAGKTIVADFAMHLAEEKNVKAFYTTPIKALSNQKYHDLVDIYGSENVGLLTGDTSINSEANIVVMTTEVLRNMLYENSETLRALRYVILDEVHYLADKFRGPVWEEVIIHLPESVKIVGLSATVSNVEDFCAWIESVRGATKLVVSEKRPVPLEQHVMVQSDDEHEPELIDLYRHSKTGVQTDKLNAKLVDRIDQLDRKAVSRAHEERRGSKNRHRAGGVERRRRPGQVRRYTPRRWAVVDELNFMGLLPGIYFIFSRNGCDEAVEQCLRAGLELTTKDEVMRIRAIVDEMVEGELDHADLKALGFARFRYALEEGFAPHHAGMVALFRQIVERLFEEGLVKMVFATETLALGINMPARCVVIEKLEKFNGVDHVTLTPGEYTQLTGRAGRRGIDTIGHAVIVDHRGFVPATAASLSSKRVYPLHSSFKPTFNMAVNLLNSSSYETARDTLDHSFAQWEANESAEDLVSRIQTLEKAVDGYEKAFACSHGDFKEFMTNRQKLSYLQKDERRHLKRQSFRSDKERSQAFLSLDRRIEQLKTEESEHPCKSCPDFQNHLKWGHRWLRESRELQRARVRYMSRTGSVARQFDQICSVLSSLGYLKETGNATGSNSQNVGNNVLASQSKANGEFVASSKGHANDVQPVQDQRDYQLTLRGQLLRHLYSEYDLVLSEAIIDGFLDKLEPEELAATLSALVYQARRGGDNEPRRYPGGPDGPVALSCRQLRDVFSDVEMMREDADLDELEPLDFGLVDVIYDWARGDDLAQILHGTELTGGDFVRNAKRLSDVLQQISTAGDYYEHDNPHLAQNARKANQLINRGIVAYSGVD